MQVVAETQCHRLTRRRLIGLVSRATLSAFVLSESRWTSALAAPSTAPASLAAVKATLAAEIGAYPGTVGLAVTDFQTGETIDVNGHLPLIGGCTSNLFLLYAVVEDLAAGAYSVPQVDWMVRAAVGASDPRWARELAVRVGRGSLARGVDRVAALMQRIGVRSSVYDHAPSYWSQYSRGNQENLVTAVEANLALGKLYHGELFDARWTDYALAKLLDVRPRLNSMIPGQLPRSGVRVAHKVGFINLPGYSTRNDAGIVLLDRPSGTRAYAFTFLSQNNRSYFAAAPFAARLSHIAFDHFNQIY